LVQIKTRLASELAIPFSRPLYSFFMHLIFSTLITEKRLHQHIGTRNLRNRDRVSVAASTIDGLRNTGIKFADFYLAFDETTSWARQRIVELLNTLDFDYELHPFRLETFSDWTNASQRTLEAGHDQILLFTNDDHVKVASDDGEFWFLRDLLTRIQVQHPDKTIMVPLSHFPEVHAMVPIAKSTNTLLLFAGTPLVPCQIPGGPILMSAVKFREFWRDDFTAGSKFVGLENPFGPSLRLVDGYLIPPRQEILRHADSYGHIGAYKWPYQILEPEICIPREVQSEISIQKYQLTQVLRSPKSHLYKTVLSENPRGDLVDTVSVALLKSGYLRPSLLSIGWVSSKYNLSKKQRRQAIFRIIISKPALLLTGVRAILIKPLLVVLNYVGWQISIFQARNLEKHFKWYLTYGSSVGYSRLAYLSLVGKIRKSFSK
jgi:hypothetical protein